MANEQAVYYLDAYNQSNPKSFLDSTMRLYVKDFSDKTGRQGTDRLILIAPLISPLEISGQNSWEAAGSNFKDLVGEAYAQAKENVASGVKGVVDLFGMQNDNLRRVASLKMDSPVESIKRYNGTDVNVPTSITATYYSGPASDFAWFEGGGFDHKNFHYVEGDGEQAFRGKWVSENIPKPDNKPLKFIAKKLIPLCLGYMDADEEKLKKGTGDLLNTVTLRPPAMYSVPPHQWSTEASAGTFTLKIGSTASITGLLPTNIEIKPSKLLTTSEDYYNMTVTISLTQGRKYYSNELVKWIDTEGASNK